MAEISPKLIKELVDNIKNLKRDVGTIGKDVNSIDDVISEKLVDSTGSFDPDNLRDSIIKGIKKSGLDQKEFPVDEMVDKISNKFISTTTNTIDEVFSAGSKRIIKEILASSNAPKNIDFLDKKSLEKMLSEIKSDNNTNEITFDIGEIAPANDNSLANSGNILIGEDLPDVVNLDEPKEPLAEEETDNLSDINELSENIIDSIKELTETKEPTDINELSENIIDSIKELTENKGTEGFNELSENIIDSIKELTENKGTEGFNELSENIIDSIKELVETREPTDINELSENIIDSIKELTETKEPNDFNELSKNIIDSIKELNITNEPDINSEPIDFIQEDKESIEEIGGFVPLTNEQSKILTENEIEAIENTIDSSITESNKKAEADKVANPDMVISIDDLITNTKSQIENDSSYNKEELVDKVDAVIDSTKTIEDKLEFTPPVSPEKKDTDISGDTINNVNDILNEFTEIKQDADIPIITDKEKIDTLAKEHDDILVRNEVPKLKKIIEKNKEQDEVLTSNLELGNKIESLIATMEATNIANMKDSKEQKYEVDSTTIKEKKKSKKDTTPSNDTKDDKKVAEYNLANLKLLEEIVGLLSGPLRISDNKPNRPSSRFN